MRSQMCRMLSMALFCIAGTAQAQTYPVKKCDAPKIPLGVLHGQGQVSYRMYRDGRADTGSIRIVSIQGFSPGALRSAAVRLIGACRFDRSADTTSTDVFVVDAIGFDSANTVLSPATVVDKLVTNVEVPPHRALPTDPVEATDTIVDERPRRIACNEAPDLPSFTGIYQTRQDRDAAVAAYRRQNTGSMVARVIINEEGRIAPGGVTIVSSTNPMMNGTFVAVLASCRYVPGRIAGIPAPTIVETRTGSGRGGGLPPP